MTNKKTIFKYFLWELIIPICFALVFTIVYCILYSSYYVIPSSLDYVIELSYTFNSFGCNLLLSLSFGIIMFAIYNKKIKSIIITSVLLVVESILVPLLSAFIKITFFNYIDSPITASYLKELIENDYLQLIQNLIRNALGFVLIVISYIVITKILKKEIVFKKPYIIPNNGIQITAIIYLLLFFVPSFILFIKDTTKDYISLIIEILYLIFGYFLIVFGYYIFNKNAKTQA